MANKSIRARWRACPGSGVKPSKMRGEQTFNYDTMRIHYQEGFCEVCQSWRPVNAKLGRVLRKHNIKEVVDL